MLTSVLFINGVQIPAICLEKFLQSMWEQAQENVGEAAFQKRVEERVKAELGKIIDSSVQQSIDDLQLIQEKIKDIQEGIKWSWEK